MITGKKEKSKNIENNPLRISFGSEKLTVNRLSLNMNFKAKRIPPDNSSEHFSGQRLSLRETQRPSYED